MRLSRARFSDPASSLRTPSWADFITNTFGFEFSVHTGRPAGRAEAVRAEFQRLGHSVSVAAVDLHLSGITAERHAKAVAHDVSLSPMRRVLSSRSDRGRLERRNSQRSTGSSVGRSFPRG